MTVLVVSCVVPVAVGQLRPHRNLAMESESETEMARLLGRGVAELDDVSMEQSEPSSDVPCWTQSTTSSDQPFQDISR